MKKILSMMITCILLFSLTACGSNGTGHETDSSEDQNVIEPGSSMHTEAEAETGMDGQKQETKPKTETETVVTDKNSSRALVVYFSWSGNTESVANAIARQTGADVFAIVPEKPYTDDYDALLNIVAQEKESSICPAIAENIENIDQYDIIYAGYPNWWSDMPMILYTFFDSYDFSSKTIAPFCTSGGGGIANTVESIRKLEPDADVLEGLHISGSSASDPDDVVSEWLSSLGLAE